MDIKQNLATNLIKHRKKLSLTQAELAEKLNYSDKAVSKWERAEAVPDIEVLKKLADLYDTTIDALIAEPKESKINLIKNLPRKRLIICLCSFFLVWLVAVVFYSFIGVISPVFLGKAWLGFIVAIPISFVVLLVLTAVWGKNFWNMLFTSIVVWTSILTVYLFIVNFTSSNQQAWMTFLIGIPLQILIVLWFFYKRINRFNKKNKVE